MSAENDDEMFENILRLCETDPDAGLRFINKISTDNPSLNTFPFLIICKIRAYQVKGVLPIKERPWVKAISEPEELLLYINDENLNAMESALLEIRRANEIDPSILSDLGKEWEEQFDALSSILNRCRPGRVQQICGKTKMQFFNMNQIKVIPNISDETVIPSDELKEYVQILFEFPSIVKSLLIFEKGTDPKMRKYIHLWAFDKLFGDFRDGETFGEARLGSVYLFNDGTFSYTLDDEKQKQSSPQFCTNCGKEISSDVKFCGNCGNRNS